MNIVKKNYCTSNEAHFSFINVVKFALIREFPRLIIYEILNKNKFLKDIHICTIQFENCVSYNL